MKRKLFILAVLFPFTLSTFAQRTDDDQRRANFEKFKAKRMEYISAEMELTSDESAAFWPLCDELQKKKFELNRNLRQEIKQIQEKEKTGDKPVQAEYEKLIHLSADVKVKEAELDKEYLNKFKKIITSQQIFKYQRAEMHFARKMMNENDELKNQHNTPSDKTKNKSNRMKEK